MGEAGPSCTYMHDVIIIDFRPEPFFCGGGGGGVQTT